MSNHPQVDLSRWMRQFPLDYFQQSSGPRRFHNQAADDPRDLWKPSGDPISSPADLSKVEWVRRQVALRYDLGPAKPVDLFLWQVAPAPHPYLTRIGGIPYRDKSSPWPVDRHDNPYTFVAQFCFLDSLDILPISIPGDLLLVFFRDHEAPMGEMDDVGLEWVRIRDVIPIGEGDCPKPSFTVPRLTGVIRRFDEFPSCEGDPFRADGHVRSYLFPTTQSTKIGTVTYFVQGDPRLSFDGTLICTLNSLEPHERWPFVDLKDLPGQASNSLDSEYYGWGPYEMMFGDVGCMYFFIDSEGTTHWRFDSY